MSHVTRNSVRFCVCQVYLHMARATCLVLRRATVCRQLTELFNKQTNKHTVMQPDRVFQFTDWDVILINDPFTQF